MDDQTERLRPASQPLAARAPQLAEALTSRLGPPPGSEVAETRVQTSVVRMRDGIGLATDVYLPGAVRAPTLVVRTPYGRAYPPFLGAFRALARRGYAVVAQDCRGTGDSEPGSWDYYVFEQEDSLDCVDWITRQPWFDGFIGGLGGSYLAQTQWCMAMHPKMTTIMPEVGGLGLAFHTVRHHMFINAYARSVGKGEAKVASHYDELERQMLSETLETGLFNEPLEKPFSPSLLERFPDLAASPPAEARRRLWEAYCALPAQRRAELLKLASGDPDVSIITIERASDIFGQHVAHDAHMFPAASAKAVCERVLAPPLMVTGWYDWGLNDALATWTALQRHGREAVRRGARLLIGPSAHNMPGYREGQDRYPELKTTCRTPNLVELQDAWCTAVREDRLPDWPEVIYYLMGANQWRCADAWPVPGREVSWFLQPGEALAPEPARAPNPPDAYLYDPERPPFTVGGAIVSSVFTPGSVDVSLVQQRDDVLVYTTAPLEADLDIVGPVRLVLYASSSAVDTDFVARLSDVHPDGRAVQLQNGVLRTRFRDDPEQPQLMTPGQVYRLEIDMWATANRFRAGHRIRLDISSADFPRFERNANRGGEPGAPIPARQQVFHDAERPSRLVLWAAE